MDGSGPHISFRLTVRSVDDETSSVLLRLYRDGKFASETVVSTVKQAQARMILLMSGIQLRRLGYGEHEAEMPRATPLFTAA